MLSSPHDSPFILVLCVSRSSKFRRGPMGPLSRGGVWKCRNFRPITCYISETVEDRWIGRTQGEAKCGKTLIHFTRLLKINHSPPIYRYISEMVEDRWVICCETFDQHWILDLSIHVTFTAIVLGAYAGRQNVLKWRTFGILGWITGKRLKIGGTCTCCDAFDKHWILFPSM